MIAAWIGQTLLFWVGLISLLFAIVIPLLVRRILDPLATEIENRENALAQEISSASHAQREAEVFGYLEIYHLQLTKSVKEIQLLESKFHSRSSLFQGLITLAIGTGLVAVSLSAHNDSSLLPIYNSMSIFLILIGFEGFTTWFPNLFIAGKNRRASKTVEELSQTPHTHATSNLLPSGYVIHAKRLEAYWDEPFLAPISFEIQEGETVLITGASGVGKSTLAAAMLGFSRYKGLLTIGGVEVRQIENLNQYISGSLQNSYVFNTTLRENLKIADEMVDDTKLQEVLDALELDEISLDELLGEFGRPLSGGEAKRLAVSRALLSPAPIIILDEPLEHLDHERAGRIEKSITRYAAGRTLIVITHAPWLQYSRKLLLARE
jgi:ATP-binding cassette subfamily C protein CydC